MISRVNRIAWRGLLGGLVAVGCLLLGATKAVTTPGIAPPWSHPDGKSYSEWSAAWWTWAMSLPVDDHPFIDTPNFDITAGQSGHVWFLASPLGNIHRMVTTPAGPAIFLAMNTAEASNLEGLGDTEEEQRATAEWFTNHASNSSCTVDGQPVANIAMYRVQSPQFTFTAPTPWIFGDTGGAGTAVADGYYAFIYPLSVGHHTIRFTEHWHFTAAEDGFDFDDGFDTTYDVTVQ